MDLSEIENNSKAIVRGIDNEALHIYKFISSRYQESNIKSDPIFQFTFRSAYKIDNAGLTSEFKESFFTLFQEAKQAGSADIKRIALELYKIKNRKGLPSLQFSFATKLAHTIDTQQPIYDKEVARFFGFTRPNSREPAESRIKKYMEFHEKLRSHYDEIIRDNLLSSTISLLQSMHGPIANSIPTVKLIDFIIWSAGKNGHTCK